MKKNCLNCGKLILDKRGDAKFCNKACRNKYNYSHHVGELKLAPKEKENLLEESLRGVVDNEPKIEEEDQDQEKPPNKNAGSNIDPDFFNDLLSQRLFNVDNKLEQKTDKNDNAKKDETEQEKEIKKDPVKNLLPAKYITKEIKIENGFYGVREFFLKSHQSQKQQLEQEFAKLQAELKFQGGRNGNGLITAGGIGGGIFSFIDFSENKTTEEEDRYKGYTLRGKDGKEIPFGSKKDEKTKVPKTESSPTWENIFKVAFGIAIGASLGYLAKGVTEEWREKDKQQRIVAIKKRMQEIIAEHQGILGAIKVSQKSLGQTPQYRIETQQVLNPDYVKALNAVPEKLNTNQETKPNKNLKKGFKQTEPIKFKSDKIIKATELGKREYRVLNFEGLWREFFGLPSLNFHILIHGNSGEGKSTYCFWLARYLAENFGRVLYVSGEEGLNKTFHDKLKYCEAEVENFYILDVRTGDEFMQEVDENDFHFIILDSLHDMDIDAKKLKEIFERYKNTAFIGIDQNNKKGELLGANEKKHICDVVVNVKNYTAETTKNRFKEKGMSFKTEDFTKKSNDKNKGSNDNLDSDRTGIV